MSEDRILTVIFCGAIVLLLYVLTLGFIFSDLWAGVRKAKQRGEMRISQAYKRTIEKINKYFNMLIVLTMVDGMMVALLFFLYYFYGYDIPMLPLFTFFGTCYVGFVEVTSITEPADIKEKKQQDDFKRMVMKLIAEDKSFRERILDVLGAEKENE